MVDRRRFLATVALSVPALRADADPIGIGFLGASYSHFKGKFEVLRESKDWRLIGICESDAEIRASLEKSGVALLTREALLSHPQIRVIAVESSLPDHAADGLAAESGKHVHLEKPPASHLKDFQTIVNTVHSRGRLLQIGYMWRYRPGSTRFWMPHKMAGSDPSTWFAPPSPTSSNRTAGRNGVCSRADRCLNWAVMSSTPSPG